MENIKLAVIGGIVGFLIPVLIGDFMLPGEVGPITVRLFLMIFGG